MDELFQFSYQTNTAF